MKKGHIVRHTASELRLAQERGADKSDWAAATAMTDAEVEAAIASDPDEADLVVDWARASVDPPRAKAVLNMRVDHDVLDFFRREGRGYQTKINAVLRSYVEQRRAGDRAAEEKRGRV